mmetsp:Transcript_20984/g.50658  ORF Transcript_20984/g.50658 Transcript_20984/m.50658 type:complete len:221 (+) Transcript_20984:1569-2231(+)
MARSRILGTFCMLLFASSSFAAVNQICGSLGTFLRALLRTLRASWYSSRRARASQRSTDSGQHPSSTALVRRTRAESFSSSSTAAFQRRSESGISSNARLRTRRFPLTSCSSSVARTHSDTLVGRWCTAWATMRFACSGGWMLEASIHTSSLSGTASHPCMMRLRPCATFPAMTSRRDAAIHAGECLGLEVMADLRRRRACLISATSAFWFWILELRSVR